MKASSSGTLRTPAQQAVHSRRQEEILEKAVLLFAAHGYADTDTQFLANQLQVGKGTLYRYFPSKEELFLAAV
ncbi:MAG: helix-turn-helix domain-containing protein, partial [Thermoguttaceae bacterium]